MAVGVLFCPRRRLVTVVVAMVAIGPLYRLYHALAWAFWSSQSSGLTTYIFTLTCFDTLGSGAVLAIIASSSRSWKTLRRRLSSLVLPAGIALLVVLWGLGELTDESSFVFVLFDLALAMVFCWVVFAASVGFRGWVGAILRWRPLRYLGKISYGVYVYHPLVPAVLEYLAPRLGLRYELFSFSGFLVSVAVTVLVSALSWHVMERPVNDLKRYFR